MIGIDITNISRFEEVSESLIKRILHKNEVILYKESENKPRFLAKKWSIKEALFKADNSLMEFSKIELIDENRKTTFRDFEISTSTEDDYYIAIVKKEN